MDYKDVRKFLRGKGYRVSRKEGTIESPPNHEIYNLGNVTREGTIIILTGNPNQFKEALELGIVLRSEEISFGYEPWIEESTLNILKNLESLTDISALFSRKNKK